VPLSLFCFFLYFACLAHVRGPWALRVHLGILHLQLTVLLIMCLLCNMPQHTHTYIHTYIHTYNCTDVCMYICMETRPSSQVGFNQIVTVTNMYQQHLKQLNIVILCCHQCHELIDTLPHLWSDRMSFYKARHFYFACVTKKELLEVYTWSHIQTNLLNMLTQYLDVLNSGWNATSWHLELGVTCISKANVSQRQL